ncbi:prephenate dehydratase [Nitrospina gracilis]|uniref:prephenate dehydratase n=1 Tax=Nitrospina gracilis TaxID=35801 RepID=UPI001F004937|nr:prephenate dehydratase [Nitrospina gracilis]MCF8719315.1 chorismate mutase/prephenate dehydratase [Nitrospina gracilis Nb-211]
MGKIDEIRDRIDKIDEKLLELFNRRADLAIKIGKEKSKRNESNHFHVPHREREIFERMKRLNTGPLPAHSIESIFREIFSATLALEKPLRIAYLGPETTFSHQAAIKAFGHSSAFEPAASIESIFSMVERGHVDYGIVPIENSTEGVVNLTLDCFVDSNLYISDEVLLGINLYLLSKTGNLDDIKEIYSHPQPFAQCRSWLNRHAAGIDQIPTSSTAVAAEVASKHKHAAAIAGKLAAEFYDLKIIAEKIEDRAQNTTRFLVIGKEPAKKAKRNKTSVMFSIQDEAGSLLKILQVFGRNEINLTKIQSRPLRNRSWEYLFFVDFEGHIDDPGIDKVIKTVSKRCMYFRVLGSYPWNG